MKALLLTAQSQLVFFDFPEPPPAEVEVLLRVRAWGIFVNDTRTLPAKK